MTYEPSTGLERLKPGDHVAVALSGGVDSFMAARTLMDRGQRVSAWHMVLGKGTGAVDSARESAGRLGLELNVIDLTREFERLVVGPFVRAYADGFTPSPCVACNPAVKFGLLLGAARKAGAEYIATGHYARIRRTESGRVLARPRDERKDQTYFLCRLTPDMIARVVFPLGGRVKADVAADAARIGLPPRNESQEICFLAGEDYRAFLRRRLGGEAFRPGDFVDGAGRILGRHRGIVNYTVGQRRGLGIPGPEPYYVLALDPKKNHVVIGSKDRTRSRRLTVRDLVWAAEPNRPEFEARVQIRSRHKPAPARVRLIGRSRAEVVFESPQSSIAAGQAAAFYHGDILLGGGWIERDSPGDGGRSS